MNALSLRGAIVMAGRPREFDRDAALNKAKLVFWQRGYEGTSMSDLVSALGIASARIYAAFGSKENLFVKLLIFILIKKVLLQILPCKNPIPVSL